MSKKGFVAILSLFFILCLIQGGYSQTVSEYDENISKLVGKLLQFPEKDKTLEELKTDFNLANQADVDYIVALKKTGEPDIWYRVFQANSRLNDRQKLVMALPEKTIRKGGFEFKDYSRALEESRSKATVYCYAHAEKLIAENKPEQAQHAYIELLKIARMQDHYKQLDKLIRRAILVGATAVEFDLYNKTGVEIDRNIPGRLSKMTWEYKKSSYGQQDPGRADSPYRFTLRIILNKMQVGPDQIKELNYSEERDIMRGTEVVDTISCRVTEFRQLKKAMLIGRLEFYDQQIHQVVNTIPIVVETIFTNSFGTLQGNPDAAGETTVLLLQSREAEYPSSAKMILDATDEFVKKAWEIILAE